MPGPDVVPRLRMEAYAKRIQSFWPLVYLPLWEPAGPVAGDRSGNGRNGAYAAAGVTYGQPGIGDGSPAVLLDGAKGYVNVFSAGLQGAFDPGELTLMFWAKVSAAGVWTDGVTGILVHLGADGTNNFIRIDKAAANNRMQFFYNAGGALESVTKNGVSTTGWMSLAITASASAGVNGELMAYFNGVQEGTTQTGLGTWAGNLAANLCVIGAQTTTPALPFSGYAAHAAVWDRPLTPAQVLALATV